MKRFQGDRELGFGTVELAAPRKHPKNYIDISPLPSGALRQQVVSVECQNCRGSPVWQGTSNFVHIENGIQKHGTTCLGSHSYLLVNRERVCKSLASV